MARSYLPLRNSSMDARTASSPIQPSTISTRAGNGSEIARNASPSSSQIQLTAPKENSRANHPNQVSRQLVRRFTREKCIGLSEADQLGKAMLSKPFQPERERSP